jgi:C-terminal processing protease CtpA/Prc
LKFFGEHISEEFKQALQEIKKDKNIKKIIFDLRGN